MSTDELRFNPRVEAMQPSATLAMTARAKQRLRDGHPVISLSAGEPDFDTPAPISSAAIAAIQEGFTHYTMNTGFPGLREAVARKLARDNGLKYTPDEIVCSNGAKQSLAMAVAVLCRPGDEVLIPAPYWVSYPEMVRFAGADPIVMPSTAANDYRILPEALEAAISDRTRLLILCTPSNPTGAVYSKDELGAVADVLRRHPQIYVISDEIYEYVLYDAVHVSFASLPDMWARTITINGFSKGYAMTGWRLGYLAAPVPISRAVAKMQSQFTSAPNSIAQKAGVAALEMDMAPVREMVMAFRKRRDFVLGRLRVIDEIHCPKPEGAFYLFPEVSAFYGRRTMKGKSIDNAEDLCIYLLETYNVALVPGHAFGAADGLRISYAASMADLEEAMRRIDDGLTALK